MILFKHFMSIIHTVRPILNASDNPLLMQVRAFKLPPLPGRKAPPIQIIKRVNRLFEEQTRTPCYSRDGKVGSKADNKQNIISNQVTTPKRPSSVRSYSRDSAKSNQSRNSSREPTNEFMKDQISHNVKARVSMPSVTAKSWAVYEMKQGKLIYGKRMFKNREIASLTKMMNLITIIQLVDQLKLAPARIKIKVSKQSSLMIGTSAQLKQNYVLSLYDLYFGMMLPSGNDAATQIAQIGGTLLLMAKNDGDINKDIVYNCDLMSECCRKYNNLSINNYMSQMNKVCKRLEMMNSRFANVHGLSNPDNYSCAEDLCKLCRYCMDNEVFRLVVRTQIYSVEYSVSVRILQTETNQEGDTVTSIIIDNQKGVLTWQNTNKMLREGWSGIKTGITPNAGPCLAASVEKYLNGRNLEFLVILIDSASMDARWKEVKEVVDWVIAQKIYF